MPFSESDKLIVKQKANFTCCWCLDRRNKVEIHHIVPESEDGPNIENNAAPLCGSCHTLYGMNPALRKEIRQRRDHWYEVCAKWFDLAHNWSLGLDVPLLNFHEELPQEFRDRKGIRFADRPLAGDDGPPVLCVSFYYTPPIYRPSRPEVREKWLSISADMRFAFHLGIEVCAWGDEDVSSVMSFLRKERNACDLAGKESTHGINFFGMFRQREESKLVMSVIAPTRASFSIRARISEKAVNALAGYFKEVGFAKLGW